MSVACDAPTLIANSSCYQCQIPDGMKLPVLIALGVQIAGVNPDPTYLMSQAACLECSIPQGMELPVLIALACNIVNAPPATTSPALIVTGTMTPDATGNYFIGGTYGDQDFYNRADGAFTIAWISFLNQWLLTTTVGQPVQAAWSSTSISVTGNYTAGVGATGTATVSIPI